MSIDEIKQLDVTERILLVEEIWDSIANEQENVGLTAHEKEVLDLRLASLEKDTDTLLSWDEIKHKIRV
jgi:putative addiction module component (TIGR02574 family)